MREPISAPSRQRCLRGSNAASWRWRAAKPKRLVYRTLSELAATSWDSGAAPRPVDDVAPLHHGVGASVKPLLPLAPGLGSGVAEPVVVAGGALVASVQGSMFDAFEAPLS